MKKHIMLVGMAAILALASLQSCSKSELQNQLNNESELADRRGNGGGHHGGGHHGGGHHGGGHHGGGHHGGGHHGGGHHGNNHCGNHHCNNPHCPNNPPQCPTAIPAASSFTYSLDFISDPLRVEITADVVYANAGPAGTFNVELRDALNLLDTAWIIPAPTTPAGQTATFRIERFVDYVDFPCTLIVEGRPLNLVCPGRSSIEFIVENNLNKQ